MKSLFEMTQEERNEFNARMRTNFEKVQPRTHWKDPIDSILPAGTTREELNEIAEAIEFYTCTSPIFSALADGRIRCTARGYWGGPAA